MLRTLILSFTLMLAACGTTNADSSTKVDGTISDRLGAWYDDNGSVLTDLAADTDAITTAANDQNIAGLAVACQTLSVDAADAQDLPPMPDPELESEWSAALDEFRQAGDDCYQGATSFDSALLDSAVSHLSDATDHTTNVNDRLTELLGD